MAANNFSLFFLSDPVIIIVLQIRKVVGHKSTFHLVTISSSTCEIIVEKFRKLEKGLTFLEHRSIRLRYSEFLLLTYSRFSEVVFLTLCYKMLLLLLKRKGLLKIMV